MDETRWDGNQKVLRRVSKQLEMCRNMYDYFRSIAQDL